MSTKFIIRRANATDVEALVSFNQAMALETEAKSLSADTLRPGVLGVFDDERRGFYLVAQSTEGDTVVAALLVTFEWSDWRNGTFWWVQSVYVQSAWRGKGIYRALYAKVKEMALAAGGVCGVRLYVERNNDIARKVYERLGMHQTAYRLYEEEFEDGS